MALAHYRDLYWFPSGALAANVPARIFPFGSNGLATLWADQAGTIPLTNPLNTDGGGFLDFWAEEGEYWVYIDARSFRVSVGNPVNLDAWDGASVALSTGVLSGGNFTAAGTSIAVQETVGYVVDYATDDVRPTLTRVHIPAQNVALSPAALLRTLTWWQVDANGNFIELLDDPTAVERRTRITLGFSIVFGGVVVFTKAVPVVMEQPANQFADLTDFLGPFIVSGCVHSANGVNLSWNITAGQLFSRSFNHTLVPDNPNVAPIAAQSPAQFRRALSNTTVFGAPVTTIDPANYDLGGVLTPVGGGTNTSTIQRVFVFAQDNAPDQLVVQYGQRTYSSLTAAVAGIGIEPYVVNPAFVSALVGWICVIRTATNLSDPAQAVFVQATAKFSRP
jgi:hypothetical protein